MTEINPYYELDEQQQIEIEKQMDIAEKDLQNLYQYLKEYGTKEDIEQFIKDFNWKPAKESLSQIKKLKDNALVVQSNELAEASQNLTSIELRIVYNLIGLLNPMTETDFISTKVYIKDLAKLCELDLKNAYGQIDRACDNIMKKPIILNSYDRNGKKITLRRTWFTELDTFEGEGYIQFRFHPDLKDELLQFHKYGRGYVSARGNIINKLGEVFPMRFFNLMIKNLKMRTCEYTLEQIIEMFQLQGKYVDKRVGTVNSAMLIKRVIKSAVDKINQVTDLDVKFTPIKVGRRIEAIRFFISMKPTNSESATPESLLNKPTAEEDVSWIKKPEVAKMLSVLKSHGFGDAYRSPVLGKFKNAEDFIAASQKAIAVLTENRSGKIRNAGALLFSTIMDYDAKKERFFAEEEEKQEQEKQDKIRAKRAVISLANDWLEIIKLASEQQSKEDAITVLNDGEEYRQDLLRRFKQAYQLAYNENYDIKLEIARITVNGVETLLPLPKINYDLLKE